jgi:hypothetical protein
LFGVQVDALQVDDGGDLLRKSVTRGDAEMATYGISSFPGRVPFTGYTNTLGPGAANQEGTSGYVHFNGIQQGDDRIAKMLRNGGMTGGTTSLLYTLLGAAAGNTATKSKKQIKWEQGSPGGLIPIEQINLMARNTTAALCSLHRILLM